MFELDCQLFPLSQSGFCMFWKIALATDRPTDRRTNGPTDQRTNGPTDRRTDGPKEGWMDKASKLIWKLCKWARKWIDLKCVHLLVSILLHFCTIITKIAIDYGHTDQQSDGPTDGRTNRWSDRKMGPQMDQLSNRQTNGPTDGWSKPLIKLQTRKQRN